MIRLFRHKPKAPKNRGFCNRCEFSDRTGTRYQCARPVTKERNPVTGAPAAIVGRLCADERADQSSEACGTFGRHFKSADYGW